MVPDLTLTSASPAAQPPDAALTSAAHAAGAATADALARSSPRRLVELDWADRSKLLLDRPAGRIELLLDGGVEMAADYWRIMPESRLIALSVPPFSRVRAVIAPDHTGASATRIASATAVMKALADEVTLPVTELDAVCELLQAAERQLIDGGPVNLRQAQANVTRGLLRLNDHLPLAGEAP